MHEKVFTYFMTVYTPNNGFTANDASFYGNKFLFHDLQAAAAHCMNLHIATSFQLQFMLQMHIN